MIQSSLNKQQNIIHKGKMGYHGPSSTKQNQFQSFIRDCNVDKVYEPFQTKDKLKNTTKSDPFVSYPAWEKIPLKASLLHNIHIFTIDINTK